MADHLSIKFYICKHCGNIVGMINDSGVVPACCGEKMNELVPNTTDAAKEKHVPVITVKGNEVHVAVGSVAGTRYSGVAVGYWVDSPYLGGGRHPWEISEIKEG